MLLGGILKRKIGCNVAQCEINCLTTSHLRVNHVLFVVTGEDFCSVRNDVTTASALNRGTFARNSFVVVVAHKIK